MHKLIIFGVGFDSEKANEAVASWVTPLTQWLNLIIPGLTGLACLIVAAMFFMDEEEKREQKSYLKRIKPILWAGVVSMSINVILQIFGIK